MKTAAFLLLLTLVFFVAPMAHPQNASSNFSAASTTSGPALTGAPDAILNEAAKMNGLSGPAVQPWHLKVRYQIFDDAGKPQKSGTYEEFRVSEKIYKRTYISDGFTQTDFGTERGLYRTGNLDWPTFLEMQVRSDLVQPVPRNLESRDVKLKISPRTLDQLQMQCVIVRPKNTTIFRIYNAPEAYPFTHYCFDREHPMLRFSSQGNGNYDTLYNHIILFQGQYVAREVRVATQMKAQMSLHVEMLDNLPKVPDSMFVPPADAVGPINGKIILPLGLLNTLVSKRCTVESFFSIQHTEVQGTVLLQTTIGKDGRVISAEALSGPKELKSEAVQCLRKYEFRPFLVQGEPVEVEGKFELGMAIAGIQHR